MSAWSGGVEVSNSRLIEIITKALGLPENIDLGETGRVYVHKFFGEDQTVKERADFTLYDLCQYDPEIYLSDDDLTQAAEDGIRSYVESIKAGVVPAVKKHAEAWKAEMLSHPPGS